MMIVLLAYIVVEAAVLLGGVGVGFDSVLNAGTTQTALFGLGGAVPGAAIGAAFAWLVRRSLPVRPAPLPLWAASIISGWVVGGFIFWVRAGSSAADWRLVFVAATLGSVPGVVVGCGLSWLFARPLVAPPPEPPAAAFPPQLATVQTLSQQIKEVMAAHAPVAGEISPLGDEFVAVLTLNVLRFYIVCPTGYPKKAPTQVKVEQRDRATGVEQELDIPEARLLKSWADGRTLLSVVNAGLILTRTGASVTGPVALYDNRNAG